MYLEIITPEKKLFSGETELVKLPGTLGSFEVLMNHAPAISTLAEGKIKVKEPNGNVIYFEITGGVVEIQNNNIIVLVDSSRLD
ncbi:MAG: ATP synthase F1 subunit epsilon [Prolixibacteraceae bacterium]|jgi:F-type H+-transporting ATPase subunit epsilon|nr:ATP synthase F1 subunit epsilon [Prolixibacteraceae bacterium]